MRDRFHFPGMAILQFAFGEGSADAEFRPHNYPRDVVAYTGTHDNDTAVGWWKSAGEMDSTRRSRRGRKEKEFALHYLQSDGRR